MKLRLALTLALAFAAFAIPVGATIIRTDRFEGLSEDQQKVLADTGTRAHQALDEADQRVRERLAGRVYPKSLLDAVIAAAGKQE